MILYIKVGLRLSLNLSANSHSLILIKSQLILDSICCIDLPEAVRVVSSANILILEFSTQFGKSYHSHKLEIVEAPI